MMRSNFDGVKIMRAPAAYPLDGMQVTSEVASIGKFDGIVPTRLQDLLAVHNL